MLKAMVLTSDPSPVNGSTPLTDHRQPSTVWLTPRYRYRLRSPTTVNRQPSTVNRQQSTVNSQPPSQL
ncbi:hypothetical protein NWP21_12205 [Anabaenopsis sp. FSS-46]|uniref:hypothetical protein n=1 Tax=Anabaenopsis sp. FSS-46 TaxID=2971766 RepID=UPI002475A151|nr:hypothetical protein [Anabaenopsis sp. FSS-46]MDH6099589.1 hypothetical protein [Anabaenopsis sp. FSS-46]